MAGIWQELKKRSVVRVSIAYVVTAWLLLQVADVILNNIGAPDWLFPALLVVIAIGFPLALILAWLFEITPEGIKKERDADHAGPSGQFASRKLDFVIIGILALAVTVFALDKFVWNESSLEQMTSDDQRQTIAVMPFLNMSADPDQEYMSDGVAEEILNLLVRIPQLRVTSRASAFTYKDTDYRTSDVGRELGVNHLLLGSVRRAGERIRISAQLVDVQTDSPVWSETWERTLDDIFAIQDEVAVAVVNELKLQLLDAIPVVARTDPDIYEIYLQAASFVNLRSTVSMGEAEKLLLEVIAADPDYLPAQLLLARTYMTGSATGTWHPREATPSARKIAESILERDADNVEALAMLYQIAKRFDYDHQAAGEYLDRALAADTSHPTVQGALSIEAALRGNIDEAIGLIEEQRSTNPMGMVVHYILGQQYMAAGRPEDAATSYRRAVQLSPGASGVHFYLGMALLAQGKTQEALSEFELETRDGYQHTGRAIAFQTMGDTKRATEELDKVIAIGDRWTYQIAMVHAFLNEADEAIYWLERVVERRDTSLIAIRDDRYMNNIRDDPRFIAIERKVTGQY